MATNLIADMILQDLTVVAYYLELKLQGKIVDAPLVFARKVRSIQYSKVLTLIIKRFN